MTLGGIASVAATAPAGALIDATTRKRIWVIVTGMLTVLASGLLWLSPSFGVVVLSQIATGIAGAATGSSS